MYDEYINIAYTMIYYIHTHMYMYMYMCIYIYIYSYTHKTTSIQ